MAYSRLNVHDLIKQLVRSDSVVEDWDVLCSYDLKSLNKVLLHEYEKHPVNSHMQFSVTKKIIGSTYKVACDLKFGNPTLSFSTAESGIYDLQFPIEINSYCNQTFRGMTTKTTIPKGYYILTSGPLKTVKGTGRGQEIISSNQVVEFGDQSKASVILHFGKDLRSVRSIPQKLPEDLQGIFEDITNNFSQNVNEIDYDLVQVVKNKTAKAKDLILTPKSFIFTTMADERDKQSGVLNIWIQTKESNRTQGNPQPAFYPNAAVLPVPLGHTSSIIFSHKLINKRYLKPALEEHYHVSYTDIIVDGQAHIDSMSLVPIKKANQNFYVNFAGIDVRSLKYEVDYNTNPFQVYAYNNELHWVWKYETYLKYVETKVVEDMSLGISFGVIIGGVVGFLFGGPPGAMVGAGLGASGGASTAGGIAGTFDKIEQFLKLTVSLDKPISFTSIDNTKFSAKIDLEKEDLKIDVVLANSSGFSLFKTKEWVISSDEIKTRFVPRLQSSIFMPDIDFGTLDYFAEANVLFNEGRFKISPNKAIHIPYDTLVLGDIHTQEHKIRKKRQENKNQQIHANYESVSNSGSKITSPINSAVKWFNSGLEQFKILNPLNIINRVFVKSEQIKSDTIGNSTYHPVNIDNYNINSTLMLSDLIIRSFSKIKPHCNAFEDSINFVDSKVYAISVVTEFEELLNTPLIKKCMPEAASNFNPVLLMSKIEKEVINGNHTEVRRILHQSIFKDKSNLNKNFIKMEEKIDKILKQQNKILLLLDI